MKVLRTISELDLWARENAQQTLGFVPTMGALHSGHYALVEASRMECDATLVSIYVNPTQFNNADDLANYPSTIDEDLAALRELEVDAVYLPIQSDIYPNGPVSRSFDFNTLGQFMEGAGRPGHFEGMATVVTRFFELIKPDVAYFGEKDYQQLAIIRFVVEQENWPLRIQAVATVREDDGLAKSSRNLRLTPEQRLDAAEINARIGAWISNGNWSKQDPSTALEALTLHINEVPSLQTEYIEIADAKTLVPLKSFDHPGSARVFVAVQCGKVRLIDNYPLF